MIQDAAQLALDARDLAESFRHDPLRTLASLDDLARVAELHDERARTREAPMNTLLTLNAGLPPRRKIGPRQAPQPAPLTPIAKPASNKGVLPAPAPAAPDVRARSRAAYEAHVAAKRTAAPATPGPVAPKPAADALPPGVTVHKSGMVTETGPGGAKFYRDRADYDRRNKRH